MRLLNKLVVYLKVGGSSGSPSDTASTMMQKFWDSTLTLEPPDIDEDGQRYD